MKAWYAADRARYYRDHEKRRKASDEYQAANPEVVAAAKLRWQERNQEKRKAHHALNNAIRDGKITKGPCEVCGSEYRIHGHHVLHNHGELHRKVV